MSFSIYCRLSFPIHHCFLLPLHDSLALRDILIRPTESRTSTRIQIIAERGSEETKYLYYGGVPRGWVVVELGGSRSKPDNAESGNKPARTTRRKRSRSWCAEDHNRVAGRWHARYRRASPGRLCESGV
jgi:hypothetical protein